VRVQAVSGHVGPNRELFDTCISDLPLTRVEGDAHVFEGTLACDVSGHRGYVVRVIPYHPMVNVMAEIPLVAWEQPRPQGAMKKAS
jgi:starch phosphorylase